MKFLHLSDLHIGKRIHGYSMLEDQRWILQQILEIVERYQPDGVLIAGDIYDKNVPIESGVTLFNQFLNKPYFDIHNLEFIYCSPVFIFLLR